MRLGAQRERGALLPQRGGQDDHQAEGDRRHDDRGDSEADERHGGVVVDQAWLSVGEMEKWAPRHTATASSSHPDSGLPVRAQSMYDALYDDFAGMPVLYRLFQRAPAAIETAAAGFMLRSATYS